MNSIRDYYLAGVPAYGTGIISNNVATTLSGDYGFYIDPATAASPSMRMVSNTAVPSGGAGYGFYFNGSPQDLTMDKSETALETDGIYVDCSVGGGRSDVHIRNSILDANVTSGIYLNACGSVQIEGGWISDSGATAIDVESGSNITIGNGLQIDGAYSTAAVYLNSTTKSFVEGVNFLGNCDVCIELNSSNANTVTGNILVNNSQGLTLIASSNNAIAGNIFDGVGGAGGISLDSSSNNNHYANLNSFSSSTTTPISDAGTGNQLSGASVTWPTSGDVVISNGTNSPAGVAEVDGDCLLGVSGAWAAGSCGGGGSGNYTNITALITWTNCTPSGGACTVGSNTNVIVAASIPGTYRNLIVVFEGISSATSGSPLPVFMALNTDNGGHYFDSYSQTGNGGCATSSTDNTANFGRIGFLPYTGDDAFSLQLFDESTIRLNNYVGTSGAKSFYSNYSYFLDSEGTCTGFASTIWSNGTAAAVTGFYIQVAGGSFIGPPSNVMVFGEN